MQEREEIVVGSLVALLLLIWLGYEWHHSPRFAGTFWGGILAVVGSALMLVPAAYIAVKRIKRVRTRATKWMSMRTILALHIYAGVIGPILVVLHTGHKFESSLGITLTALTLIVVVSGFVGRYLLSRLNRAVRESDTIIKQLRAHHQTAGQDILSAGPDPVAELSGLTGIRGVLRRVFFRAAGPAGVIATNSPIARAIVLSDTIADIEYARHVRAAVKRGFKTWLKLHIVLSCALYLLMGLHVWAAIHFGIRWFE
jgi:hypothetical protein